MFRQLSVILLPLRLLAGSLLTDADFLRISQAVDSHAWAAKAKADLIASADAWPASHLARYGLAALELPPEGGQWWHWYVCPSSGVRLRFEPPARHVCPTDNRTVTGWPYDQVIYSERHDQLASMARDLALAFRLSGKREYAEKSAWILTAYAGRYSSYALHDKDNRNTRSGARAHAQTLDEAIWIIPLAYAYDLLGDWLDGETRESIRTGLLLAAADTIRRYDAGVSNWQAWHNAGMAAVAFAAGDQELARHSIDGPSGFRFHLARSVTPDGFWYEGSFTYHFYALDALVQLAEMAGRNGHDLWSEEAFRKAFSAPLLFAFANGVLAPFNDATTVNLRNYSRLYESAYAHWGDPLFAAVAGSRARGRDALLFGLPDLPAGEAPALESSVFPESGYAVLRASNDHAVILKYGPHGGGHGHYDKLNFVSYFNGGILAVDPGTQSYGAPTHNTWDKTTVAHNTVVVDERNQAEAEGRLLFSSFSDGAAIVRAEAGGAYPNVRLARTMVHTADYTLDLFDVQAADSQDHTFDWVYHNAGVVTTGLPLASGTVVFGRQNGYQHLSAVRGAAAERDWTLTFDGAQSAGGAYGSVYASTPSVRGAFEYSRRQAFVGSGSGRMSYQFGGPGYLLYSTPQIAPGPVPEHPRAVKVAIYGDGSRHRVLLRVNDASDERFVTPLAVVDWTGWREFEAGDPARWPQHYLGNADGHVDLPLRTVSIELQQDPQGPRQGELFVDHVQLVHDGSDLVVADFESAVRSLRVWMLGGEATVVAAGNGLGENLTIPVPFALARRRGRQTRFEALLEPFSGAAPAITGFRRDGAAYIVDGPDWQDSIEVAAGGVSYVRR